MEFPQKKIRRLYSKTPPAVAEKRADRFARLKAAAADTASTSRAQTEKISKKPAADGLDRHKAEMSTDFGKVRMHNSRKRSYIQAVHSDHYECLWSASFRDHEKITPQVYELIVHNGGWTKDAIASVKDHISKTDDPLMAFENLRQLAFEHVAGDTEAWSIKSRMHCSEEDADEEVQSDPDSVSQEF